MLVHYEAEFLHTAYTLRTAISGASLAPFFGKTDNLIGRGKSRDFTLLTFVSSALGGVLTAVRVHFFQPCATVGLSRTR